MTTANHNPPPENPFLSGPPMVKINGTAIRRLREQKGLTQLYVATVVQVTTDTISRWENRRYPSIKKENAEKLAEALEVGLVALLEQEELPRPETMLAQEPEQVSSPEAPAPPAPTPAVPPHRLKLWLAALILAALTLTGLLRFFAASGQPPTLAASRSLPAHVPPGQVFPVLLRISTQPPSSLSLIVRDNYPTSCRLTQAAPATGAGTVNPAGQIKWVSHLEGKERLFAYLLTSPSTATLGTTLDFRGQVVAGSRGETTTAIAGDSQLTVSPHHWADRNGDNRIDDEEILAVYDQFGEVKEFAALRDEVDKLWTGGGYRWEASSHQYLVGK